jgi:tetratricopeptide (TPR) repeat protein
MLSRAHWLPLLAASLLTAFAGVAPAAAQDWRGTGRIQGVLTDEEGKPIVGATVTADNPVRGGGTSLKTDKKGRWVLGGIAGGPREEGTWNLDFEAEGYETKKITVQLPSDESRIPSVDVSLKKSGPPPELKAAAEKADAAYKEGKYEEARAEYEKLLAMRPDLAPMINQQIGFSYVQQKQYDKALEYLDKVLAADPTNAPIRAIAAQAALEGKMMDKAKELLAGLDETKITNPDVFFNMGVSFLNAGDVPTAIDYFGKTIRVDPAYVDAYYRRALGYLGQGKNEEAKADFKKVIELQPDSQMGEMSKKALAQIP